MGCSDWSACALHRISVRISQTRGSRPNLFLCTIYSASISNYVYELQVHVFWCVSCLSVQCGFFNLRCNFRFVVCVVSSSCGPCVFARCFIRMPLRSGPQFESHIVAKTINYVQPRTSLPKSGKRDYALFSPLDSCFGANPPRGRQSERRTLQPVERWTAWPRSSRNSSV